MTIQVEFGVEDKPPAADVQPAHLRLQGPNQWPDAEVLPRFRPGMEAFLSDMEKLSQRLSELLALSLQLPKDSFAGVDCLFSLIMWRKDGYLYNY